MIYGDTDSLFVDAGGSGRRARAGAAPSICAARSARRSAASVRERFGCESLLELEFEKLYRRFFMPEVRGGKVGSKKRYAGLLVEADGREHIEFVGLESVRRDWTRGRASASSAGCSSGSSTTEPVEAFVRDFVADAARRALDDDLAYRKAVRKDLDAYTKTTPPHVQAARKQAPRGRPYRRVRR